MSGSTPFLFAPGPPPSGSDPLRAALIDSRQRWQDFVALASDLAFETDEEGRLVFVSPDTALGWPPGSLIGESPEVLLVDPGTGTGLDPFRPQVPMRNCRTWLRRFDGSLVCFTISAAPLRDAENRIVGARGMGSDVTAAERQAQATAAALRRAQVLDHVLWQMRQEVLAPNMMQAALEAVRHATGAEAVAVLDTLPEDPVEGVLYTAGIALPGALRAASALLGAEDPAPRTGSAPDGRALLTSPSFTRFGERIALVLWRAPGARAWEQDDLILASSIASVVRVVLEHEAIQREMARQARTDPLTGLLNRRAVLEEVSKRIDRLDREGLPGTLMFIDLDNFKPVNDRWGHELGDEALRLTAGLLRNLVRPADLVARLGGDEFAVWMDGADDLTASERAESLRRNAPAELAAMLPDGGPLLSLSIGIAARQAGQGEPVESLMRRADLAMYEVKRGGRGHWRVSHEAPI